MGLDFIFQYLLFGLRLYIYRASLRGTMLSLLRQHDILEIIRDLESENNGLEFQLCHLLAFFFFFFGKSNLNLCFILFFSLPVK